jgi:3-mercaptopyruvate sulfurtransferase SseA
VILKRLGFQKVTALFGGFNAWVGAKYPLEAK